MGSGNERSNTRRPRAEGTAIATQLGRAIVTCEIAVTSPALALTDELALPASCSVEVRGGHVLLISASDAIAEITDPTLTERLLICIRRQNRYEAVLRKQHDELVADISGG